MSTVLLVAFTALAAFFMIAGGVPKLAGQSAMRESAAHFSIAWERYRLIGLVEVAAAAGIVIGVWVSGLGLAAGLGVVALMAGALMFHLRFGDTLKAMTPALLALAAGTGYVAVQAVRLLG